MIVKSTVWLRKLATKITTLAFSTNEDCHEGGDKFVKLCVEDCEPDDADDCKDAKKYNKNKGKKEHEIEECIPDDPIYEAGMRWKASLSK